MSLSPPPFTLKTMLRACFLCILKQHFLYIRIPLFSVTLTDDICGGIYFNLKKNHYLVWDGSHIGKDSIFNLWRNKDSVSCKVSFDPAIHYTVCVTVERFHIEDCDASVNYYHDGDSEIKAVCVLFQ